MASKNKHIKGLGSLINQWWDPSKIRNSIDYKHLWDKRVMSGFGGLQGSPKKTMIEKPGPQVYLDVETVMTEGELRNIANSLGLGDILDCHDLGDPQWWSRANMCEI